MTPENKVKARIKNLLEFVGAWYFMPAQWGFGRRGIPDFVGVLPGGRMFAIECKAGGRDATALQRMELMRIEHTGGLALIARPGNYDEIRESIVNAIKESRR